MSIPDLDKLKREADGMFDFLGEEAANHAQRPRKTKSDSESFNMPIIRKPVPVSESGALRAGSASSVPDFNDDFDFLKSDNPAQSHEQVSPHAPMPNAHEDLFEGVHDYTDERERSLQLPMLILLSTTLFVVAGAAAYWFSQNEFADLFKTDPATQTSSPAVSPAATVVAPTQEVETPTQEVVAPSQDTVEIADAASVEPAEEIATPLPSSLYTQFSTQLETLEVMLAEGKLDEAEASLQAMDRSVYGYGQAEFDDIQQQIVRMRGGDDAVAQAEDALAEQIESERLAAQAQAAEEARIAEQARLAEEARLAAEAKAAEEARIAEQNRLAEQARLDAEARAAEEARIAEQARLAEEARLAEQARLAEEARLAAQAQAAEEARIAEQARLAEEARLAAEAQAAEAARIAEQERLAEEARLAAEAKAAEEARLAEQERLAEEARLAARTKQAELAQLAEQAKQAEAARLAEQSSQADAAQQAANADVTAAPQANEQLLLEQRAAAMLAQREKAAEAQRRAAAAKAEREAQEQERAAAAKAAAEARAARERAASARLAAQRLETQRAAEAAAAQAARDARAAQAARAAALAEQNRLAANSNREQPGLSIQPRQQSAPISDADFNRVAERFVELKDAIENRDITTVIALTQQSGQRVQQMLQIFQNTEAVEARVSNIRSSNADGIISGTLKIQKLVKSGGLKVDAPDNLSSIRLTSNRTSSGWSPIGW